MKKIFLYFTLIIAFSNSYAQNDTIKTTDYSFILKDSPAQLFTMRQFNQSYLSGYRLFARELNSTSKNRTIAKNFQALLVPILLMPLTHEEGHRSVLTAINIGSISQPYFNKHGAAYVKGVTDKTLQNLRDNNLPTYIRLHTGGLESDYMLTKRVEAIGSFELDDYRNYKYEYWVRKYAILQYYVLGLFKFDINLKEEANELDRDIVGFDTYGAAKHLFRPTTNFYRYTKYTDLTGEEREFIKRIGYRSLLNLLNPLIIGKGNFKLTENTRFNVGMGYTMSPFGDFIDENIWLKFKTMNIGIYARQFQNKENWFNGFGVSLVDYWLSTRLSADISGHFWQQPVNFDFNTSNHFTGGAIEMDLKYFFFNERNIRLKGFSIDFGFIYKTKGFLPEEMYLNEDFGFRIGTTIRI